MAWLTEAEFDYRMDVLKGKHWRPQPKTAGIIEVTDFSGIFEEAMRRSVDALVLDLRTCRLRFAAPWRLAWRSGLGAGAASR